MTLSKKIALHVALSLSLYYVVVVVSDMFVLWILEGMDMSPWWRELFRVLHYWYIRYVGLFLTVLSTLRAARQPRGAEMLVNEMLVIAMLLARFFPVTADAIPFVAHEWPDDLGLHIPGAYSQAQGDMEEAQPLESGKPQARGSEDRFHALDDFEELQLDECHVDDLCDVGEAQPRLPAPEPVQDYRSCPRGPIVSLVRLRRLPTPGGPPGGDTIQRLTATTVRVSAAADDQDFAHVFAEEDQNPRINEFLAPYIDTVEGSGHPCIMVDGYSGSGKSGTMFDYPDSLAYFAADRLFALATRRCLTVRLRSLEVRHKIADKPSPYDADQLSKRRISMERRGICVPRCAADLRWLLSEASKLRERGVTTFNTQSSRTHLLCTIDVDKLGSLCLVDLAGGEPSDARQPLASSDPCKDMKKAREECTQINGSRSVLHSVMRDMADEAKPQRVRESNLTKALNKHWMRGEGKGDAQVVVITHINLNHARRQSVGSLDAAHKYHRMRRDSV